MSGPCAKRQVVCEIYSADGYKVTGRNDCAYPQLVCPREPGEGYEKCRTVCGQYGHAEERAILIARSHGLDLNGATAIIHGHYYACESCSKQLHDVGVRSILIVQPPRK